MRPRDRRCGCRPGRGSAPTRRPGCSSTPGAPGSSRASPRRRASCAAGPRANRSAARRGAAAPRMPVLPPAPDAAACRRPTRRSARAGRTASSPPRCAAAGSRAPSPAASWRARSAAVVGRRLGRDGRVTWYDRVDGETSGRLGALLGAARGAPGEHGLARGHARAWPAVELRLRAAARWHGDVELLGGPPRVRDVAALLRGAPASAGRSRPPHRGGGVARPDRSGQPARARRRG